MNNQEVEKKHEEMNRRIGRNVKAVAVGYLDINEPFEKGPVPEGFLEKLRELWNDGIVIGSLGSHDCEFCFEAKSSQEKILVDEKNGIEYMFPEMIFHYMEYHNFKPPDEFIAFIKTFK